VALNSSTDGSSKYKVVDGLGGTSKCFSYVNQSKYFQTTVSEYEVYGIYLPHVSNSLRNIDHLVLGSVYESKIVNFVVEPCQLNDTSTNTFVLKPWNNRIILPPLISVTRNIIVVNKTASYISLLYKGECQQRKKVATCEDV
jgi:hypothetical protein